MRSDGLFPVTIRNLVKSLFKHVFLKPVRSKAHTTFFTGNNPASCSGSRLTLTPSSRSGLLGNEFVREIPYADRWLDGLPVGDVANEAAQWVQVGNVRGDGLEAREKEVTDGEVGPDAIGQEGVNLGGQFAGTVVYDVVRHGQAVTFSGLPGSKRKINSRPSSKRMR